MEVILVGKRSYIRGFYSPNGSYIRGFYIAQGSYIRGGSYLFMEVTLESVEVILECVCTYKSLFTSFVEILCPSYTYLAFK